MSDENDKSGMETYLLNAIVSKGLTQFVKQ